MDLSFVLAVPMAGWTQPCASCGDEIRDGSDGIKVELMWEDLNGSSLRFRSVWHQQRHLQYLDEGEET